MEPVVPREKLKELIEKNGDSLFQDRDRCEGLLKDYCAGSRREIAAIVGALEERIPVELRSSWQTAMTPEAMRARLVQRLEDNRGLAPEIANYAVDTWSYALGVGLGRSSDRVQDVPIGATGVVVPATAAERAAADRPAGSVPAFQPVATTLPVQAGALTSQNKAVIGGAVFVVVAALALGLVHHAKTVAPPSSDTNPPIVSPVNPPQPVVAKPNDVPHENAGVDPTTKPAGTLPVTTIPVATTVAVTIDSDFNSDEAAVGDLLPATVVTPVISNGTVVVQRGSNAQLKVTRIDKSGKISGKSHVQFALATLTARGKLVHVAGAVHDVDGPSQGVRTAERTGIGGAAGAALGAITGHLFHHAGAGAAAGAGAGGAAGALTSHPAPVKVKAETVMQFRLTRGISLGS